MTTHHGPCEGLCSLDVFDIHDIERVFGLGRTAAYGITRSPGFPVPFVISSRCLRWPALAVLAFRDGLTDTGGGL